MFFCVSCSFSFSKAYQPFPTLVGRLWGEPFFEKAGIYGDYLFKVIFFFVKSEIIFCLPLRVIFTAMQVRRNPDLLNRSVGMRLQPRYPAFLLEAYLELPKPIPIGPLGIYGFSGLLGYRYVAEKEAIGLSPDNTTWYDYYTYPARGVNRPKFSGPERTSAYTSPFSFGAGALLATSFDDGWALSARVMLLLSVPSLFIVEGRASILSERIGFDSTDEPPFFAFMAWGGGSIEMGLGAHLKIPKSGDFEGKMLSINADVEARFLTYNPSQWYVNFGSEENPVDAEVITLFNAPAYLMISAQGIKGGARTEFDWRAALKTLFRLLTGSFSQLLRCQNTHLALLNSVFDALYLKKNNCLIIPQRVIRDAL